MVDRGRLFAPAVQLCLVVALIVLFSLAVPARLPAAASLINFNDMPRYPAGGLLPVDGFLYGITGAGGPYGGGIVYRFDPAKPSVIEHVAYLDYGRGSQGRLVYYSGFIWGTTSGGGASGQGTVFKLNPVTRALTYISLNSWTTGAYPIAGLTVMGSYLYGVAHSGGTGYGTVFKVDPATDTISLLGSFNNVNGSQPYQPLTAYQGVLYGTTLQGGSAGSGCYSGCGTVFSVDPTTNAITSLATFNNSNGSSPDSDLYPYVTGAGTFLYGTAAGGATGNRGTVYKLNLSTNAITAVVEFGIVGGANPQRSGLTPVGSRLYGTTLSGGSASRGTVFELDPASGTVTNVTSFTSVTGGWRPDSNLIPSGAYLWGTCSNDPQSSGGGNGSIFRYDPVTHELSTVYSFESPALRTVGGPVVALGWRFFGTATDGGYGAGGVFAAEPPDGAGASFPFDPANAGQTPSGIVLLNGDAYAATQYGGANNCGTIVKVDPTNLVLTTVMSFPSTMCTPTGPLLASGGYLYGTTSSGGASGYGGVFRVDPGSGALTTVASFDSTTVSSPSGGLVSDGTYLYGTSSDNSYGSIFKVNPAGPSIGRMFNFDCTTNGQAGGVGSLVSYAGYLYGVSRACGGSGEKLYRIDPASASRSVLYDFTASATAGDGAYGGIAVIGNAIYGTTNGGGDNNLGVLYRFDLTSSTMSRVFSFAASTTGYAPYYGYVNTPPFACGSYVCGASATGGPWGGGAIYSTDVPPTATPAAALSRTIGSPATVSTIATVADTEDAAGNLTVTVTPPAGITVTNVMNSGGTITATVGATCSAAAGPQAVWFLVMDGGRASKSGQFTVNVEANPAPTLGSYSNASMTAGTTDSFHPAVAPADNGTLTLSASGSSGFLGIFSTPDPSTGTFTISNPNAGTWTITVTATDDCGAIATRSFVLTVSPAFGTPENLSATASGPNQVVLSWTPVASAVRYEVWRNTNPAGPVGNPTTNTFTDNGALANTTYVYSVRAFSTELTSQFAYDVATTKTFTDDPLQAGMVMKAVQINELRQVINNFRAAAGLTPFMFDDDPVSTTTAIRALHVTQLRTALDQARAAIHLPMISYGESISGGSTVIRAAHIRELRDGVR